MRNKTIIIYSFSKNNIVRHASLRYISAGTVHTYLNILKNCCPLHVKRVRPPSFGGSSPVATQKRQSGGHATSLKERRDVSETVSAPQERALCNACIGLLLVIVIALLNAINEAMWRSAESTIRSLTQASGEAIANAVRRDVQSLKSFKESLLGADAVVPVAAVSLMQCYAATSPFSRVAMVDEYGRGYFANGDPANINNAEDWHNFLNDASVSRTYLDAEGQRQITMRRPLFVDGHYKGAVYGSLPLKTYAQPSAMDFFDGRGSSFMVSAWSGEYLIASPDAREQDGKTDLYTALAASPENKPERIAALRQAIGTWSP